MVKQIHCLTVSRPLYGKFTVPHIPYFLHIVYRHVWLRNFEVLTLLNCLPASSNVKSINYNLISLINVLKVKLPIFLPILRKFKSEHDPVVVTSL